MIPKYIPYIILSLILVSCSVSSPDIDSTNETLSQIDTEVENVNVSPDSREENNSSTILVLEETFSVPRHADETMAFTITHTNGIIENVVVGAVGKVDHESLEYNSRFNALINSKVIGLSFEEAGNISKLGGASLTTTAFKNALKQI